MHCPQCGQLQVSEVTRFCSRCGFLMDGVAQLLATGGILPTYSSTTDGPAERSAKFRGVRQGMILFLIGVLLVPIMGVFSAFTGGFLSEGFQMLAALFALICFVGGPLRMLYAALFEQGAPRLALQPANNFVQRPHVAPPLHVPNRVNALPPPPVNPAGGWRRPNTAELVGRPSVTENTTRLLDKDLDRESGQ
jgi:hypothetical protein